MAHWSVVAIVSVPAMTRSSMDAIKLSSWKRLSFLFFSLKNTSGKKGLKTISLRIQQAREILHSLQHCWLWTCVCEQGDKIDLILNAQHSPKMGAPQMEGLERSFGSASTSTQKQAEAQGQVLFTDSASQVWKEPVLSPVQKIQLSLAARKSSCPRAGLNPQQCSKWPFRPFLLAFRTALILPPHSWVEYLVPKVGPDPVGKNKKLRAQIFRVEQNQLMCETAESLLKQDAGQG